MRHSQPLDQVDLHGARINLHMQGGRKFLPILLCWLVSAQLYAASPKPLAVRIEKILAQPELQRGFWGIEVASLTTGKVLYAHNAEKLFTPASNTKLFTTAATLALIGPDYKFHTTVETNGTLDKYGRLTGDLILVGRGDPNLSGRELPYELHTERNDHPIQVLEQLADTLVQKGVKYIDGDIIADDSYFAFERYGEGWSQDDLVWSDGAPVSALTINDNIVFLNIQPADRAGERAFVSVMPFADYYQIDNRIITMPAGTDRKIFINREPGSTHVTLWGSMPLGDPGASEGIAIEDPAQFAATLFRQLLEARGIVIYGKDRTHHTELANLNTFSITATASSGGGSDHGAGISNQPLVLASYQSQPLIEDVTVVNKVSQNLHAEILLRLLGREKGTAGTVEGGLEVIHGFLNQAGIQPDEYVFYDGSGLSRENLVTPHAVVQLLQYAAIQPWAKDFHDSLPVAGVDGSLADRLKDLAPRAHVSAKTGSLGGVKSLSGYATTIHGQQIAFSILTNNFDMPEKQVTEAIDQVVEQIVNDAPGKKK
jgi:serine-type D-Ala-D-Ala carboxypeptidase/endopeptidase (penicillin-binding protein 4)